VSEQFLNVHQHNLIIIRCLLIIVFIKLFTGLYFILAWTVPCVWTIFHPVFPSGGVQCHHLWWPRSLWVSSWSLLPVTSGLGRVLTSSHWMAPLLPSPLSLLLPVLSSSLICLCVWGHKQATVAMVPWGQCCGTTDYGPMLSPNICSHWKQVKEKRFLCTFKNVFFIKNKYLMFLSLTFITPITKM